MADFLQWMSAFVVLMVALGLVRVARGPGYADRMMAAQLLGSAPSPCFCCSVPPRATWR